MTITEYLEREGITQQTLSEQLACSRSMIGHLVSGEFQPSLALAMEIEIATQGAVRVEDLDLTDPGSRTYEAVERWKELPWRK